MKVLILSPHCDDVPLSLGGSLINGYLGKNIEVIIVFSKSAYTENNKGNADITETTKVRRNEEKIAAEKLGYEVTFWDYGEPFVRPGFKLLKDVCNPSRDPKDDPVWLTINKRVERLLKDYRGIVIAPLGCGNHIDHRIINMAVNEFYKNNSNLKNIYPAFFEDLPYFSERDVWRVDQLKKNMPDRLSFFQHCFEFKDVDKKLNVLHSYASQMNKEYYKSIIDHWNNYRGEFIWVTNNTKAILSMLT